MIKYEYNILPYSLECHISDNKGNVVSRQRVTKSAKKSKVIHNGTTTIVILEDGSKGVAKLNPNDLYVPEIGYGIAYYRAKIKQAESRLQELYSASNI